MLRERCLTRAENKVVPRIIELMENVPSTAVGTIVKSTPGRPASDTAYHSSYEGLSYLGVPFTEEDVFMNYCRAEDSIVLEDESGRVELTLMGDDIDLHSLATGVVVAVEGTVGATGVMTVTKVHFPSMGPQNETMEESVSNEKKKVQDDEEDQDDDDAHVLLISGLDCGGADTMTSLKREMLLDYLMGHFAPEEGCRIARVIVAGGGCTRPIKPENMTLFGNWNNSGKKGEPIDTSNVTLPIRELDLFLGEMCAGGIPVDYIPGLHDPTNANWPQKPLHASLLPNAVSFVNMLSRAPNPYEARIGNKTFLGSDGYNVYDLLKFVSKRHVGHVAGDENESMNVSLKSQSQQNQELEGDTTLKEMSSLEALELTFKYNHMAPTGPDSLPTFPFKDVDPFVIEKTPHVYFAGNCDEFASKLVQEKGRTTRLVCIPSFLKTGQAVLLNIKSLDCTIVEFNGIVGATNGDEKKMEVE